MLWKHQEDGLKYLNQRKCGLLMMGVGTGKTRTTLEFIKRKGFKHVLIVGTKNSLYVWENENEKASYGFTIKTFREGLVKDRAVALRSFVASNPEGSVSVINYEATTKTFMVQVLSHLSFDCIIYDEVHRLRGHSSKQSKTAYALAKTHPNAFRLGLTGTLIYNKPLDVFGIMRFIDKNVFGDRWTTFKTQYALWVGQFGQIPVKFINLDDLKAIVQANAYIVDRREVLDLPSEQHITQEIRLDKDEYKSYNEFNKEFITLLSDRNVSAKNVLDKVNKLQQLTSGFIYQEVPVHFSNAKASALEELLEEIEDNAVVFYKYKESLCYIQEACASAGRSSMYIAGDHSDYRDWLSSPVPTILAVQISSGSEGIDFSKAAITIFYDLTYSLGQFEQCLGRTSRPTQKSKNILYYYLVIKNTIDEKILTALQGKKELIEDLIYGKI